MWTEPGRASSLRSRSRISNPDTLGKVLGQVALRAAAGGLGELVLLGSQQRGRLGTSPSAASPREPPGTVFLPAWLCRITGRGLNLFPARPSAHCPVEGLSAQVQILALSSRPSAIPTFHIKVMVRGARNSK